MKSIHWRLTAATLGLFLLIPIAAAAAEKNVIIGFREKPGLSDQAYLHGLGGKVKRQMNLIRAVAARVPEEALEKIKGNARIRFVEEDVPLALVEPIPAGIEYENAWGVARIGAASAHQQGNEGQGVKIAVMDTGIDYMHPELAPNYRGGVNLAIPGVTDPMDDSWNSHGTHVAGILGALDNGSGVVGVAPAAELYAVKVLDGAGFGTASALIAGLDWAVANGIDIANISLGTTQPSLALEEACQAADEAGMLLFAAAGNTKNSGGAVLYPARYGSVIAVSATAPDDSAVWISAVGPEIELAAPGGLVFSTARGGGYAVLTGTSQAAPHAAGAAALLMAGGIQDWDGNGVADRRDVRFQLQKTALDLGEAGPDPVFGYGLVQAGSTTSPAMLNFTLLRLAGAPGQSVQQVILDGGNYEIRIANDSLAGLEVAVYEQDVYRRDLSQTLKFPGKSQEEKTIPLDTAGSPVSLFFVPRGPANGFADITIVKN